MGLLLIDLPMPWVLHCYGTNVHVQRVWHMTSPPTNLEERLQHLACSGMFSSPPKIALLLNAGPGMLETPYPWSLRGEEPQIG